MLLSRRQHERGRSFIRVISFLIWHLCAKLLLVYGIILMFNSPVEPLIKRILLLIM